MDDSFPTQAYLDGLRKDQAKFETIQAECGAMELERNRVMQRHREELPPIVARCNQLSLQLENLGCNSWEWKEPGETETQHIERLRAEYQASKPQDAAQPEQHYVEADVPF